ncbi:MAG: hypothetical protein KME25_30690 [Symplocastrum torsivum CPER-KK1]|jgi:hypothetical protein|uniref:Uncharacterized protein n=1 Tax=Symplocastrum torsivum CPER-KK1 TaxID=450513 RepID=A0A951PR66_9CYAN|nr:hypothetical protein [Symplocastrum torsivum CPER-KK1]
MPQLPPTPVDIASEMAKVLKSTIIAACPRVGKGVVVSKAIAFLQQLYPDLEIWLIDPKDEPSELHYWLAIDPDKRCHFDLRPYDADIEKATQTFEAFLIRFNGSASSRKLLIIDEFVMLNQKCDSSFMTRLKDFLVGICSSGELSPDQALGRFVWVITQSPFTKDLGFKTRAAISTFQRVFLLNTASIQLYAIALSAGFIPNQPEKEIIEMLSVTGRVFYYSRSNSWHPVPNYELALPPQTQTQSSTLTIELVQSSGESEQVVDETVNDLKVSDDLGEPLKTIWLYAKKKGEVIKASEVQRDNSTLKSVPTKKIRQYFGLLFDLGYGELEGEGDRLGFRAY